MSEFSQKVSQTKNKTQKNDRFYAILGIFMWNPNFLCGEPLFAKGSHSLLNFWRSKEMIAIILFLLLTISVSCDIYLLTVIDKLNTKIEHEKTLRYHALYSFD